MRRLDFVIDNSFDSKTVLSFLKGKAALSHRLITKLKYIENGILLNGIHIRTIDIVHTGDFLSVNIPDTPNEIEPIPATLDILYEDSDILIINKPSGLAIHPSHNHQGDTLANNVVSYLNDKNIDTTFRSVGRLDKNTSGVVVCALNPYSSARLNGKLDKTYIAVAEGSLDGEFGEINKKIYRPDAMKTLRATLEDGQNEDGLLEIGDAHTYWEKINEFQIENRKYTVVRVKIKTGRTHQIRVHFASIGHALAGDGMYGGHTTDISRSALHCYSVKFSHPVTNEQMKVIAPLPDDMKKFVFEV